MPYMIGTVTKVMTATTTSSAANRSGVSSGQIRARPALRVCVMVIRTKSPLTPNAMSENSETTAGKSVVSRSKDVVQTRRRTEHDEAGRWQMLYNRIDHRDGYPGQARLQWAGTDALEAEGVVMPNGTRLRG